VLHAALALLAVIAQEKDKARPAIRCASPRGKADPDKRYELQMEVLAFSAKTFGGANIFSEEKAWKT
jgi:hypothetical protein